MAASTEHRRSQEENLGVVLLYRDPKFNISFEPWLGTRFRLLDPLASSFSSSLAQSVRVLLCVGPSRVTADTLSRYPSIECVVGSSAGIDHIDLAECRRRGIRVTNAGEAFSEDAADYAVALLIDVLRRISSSDRYVRAGLWPVKGDYPLASKVISVSPFVKAAN